MGSTLGIRIRLSDRPGPVLLNLPLVLHALHFSQITIQGCLGLRCALEFRQSNEDTLCLGCGAVIYETFPPQGSECRNQATEKQ